MAAHAPPNESLNRLALSCSALARSGQVLSTVSTLAAARRGLLEAAEILDNDARKSGWPQIRQAAEECRNQAATGSDAELIAICRRLATNLARQASTLATEVQQQSKKTLKESSRPVRLPPRAPETASPTSVTHPLPPHVTAPIRSGDRFTAPEAQNSLEKQATAPLTDVGKCQIAKLPIEKRAVAMALETGARFAIVSPERIIDLQYDRMWLAQPNASGTYRKALQFLATCRDGDYFDWRLPRPEEVQDLLRGGGSEWVAAQEWFGKVASRTAENSVWTSHTRWRWLRFRREVTVICLCSGQSSTIPSSMDAVRILAVR